MKLLGLGASMLMLVACSTNPKPSTLTEAVNQGNVSRIVLSLRQLGPSHINPQPVVVENGNEIALFCSALKNSLNPTGRAAGFMPTHDITIDLSDGSQISAYVGWRENIISIPDDGERRVDRALTTELKELIAKYLH